MEKAKQGICITCYYQRGCSISTSSAPSWECSEYRTSTVFSSPQASGNLPEDMQRNGIKGLCSSCESLPSCHWAHPDSIKFHCEHYQ